MERAADAKLPASMGYQWTGMAYQEKATSGQAMGLFLLAVVFVYLVLCAQYESWSIPLSVILVVPLGLLGTILSLVLRRLDVNMYTEIGIVLLIGMACKTAILIVEFAKAQHEEGKSVSEAAIEASRLRFRPIVMTGVHLHLRRFSAGDRQGGRSRQSPGTRNGRVRRNDFRHRIDGDLRPGFLCRDPEDQRTTSSDRTAH